VAVHINLDSFLPISWSKQYGNRAFEFDAFISHNRGDLRSRELMQKLSERGAKVWYDDDQDVRDRRVMERVTRALIRSRFVVVSIQAGFRDSPWCCAEYLPALNVENQAAAKRVLVAQMEPEAPIPEALAGSERFECCRLSEIDRLANRITHGNCVPFDSDLLDVKLPDVPNRDNLLADWRVISQQVERRNDANAMTLWLMSDIVIQGRVESPQHLQQARQILIEQVDLQAFSEKELSFLCSSVLLLCRHSNVDDRANGLLMLLHLAEREPTYNLRNDLFRLIATEPDDSLIKVVFPWFERHWTSMDAGERSVVELCALRIPTYLQSDYSRSPILQKLSEVTRVKLLARGPGTDSLSHKEKMHLLEERTTYILESGETVMNDSSLDQLRPLLGISDIELVFRGLRQLLFPNGPGAETRALAPCFVALVEKVTNHSARHKGKPLVAMQQDVLDYVLFPLLWCVTQQPLGIRVERIYRKICNIMKEYSDYYYEVRVYRDALKRAKAGEDLDFSEFGLPQDLLAQLLHLNEEHKHREALKRYGLLSGDD
jgi:hypothetical protein